MKKLCSIPNLLFLLLAASLFLPGAKQTAHWAAFLAVIIMFEIYYLAVTFATGENFSGAFSITYGFFIIWEITARVWGVANPILVPTPEDVFQVFVDNWQLMGRGLVNSMGLLACGFVTGIIAAVFFGLIIGWIPRLRGAIFPVVKVISPIPPLIYVPYVIAILPTFRAASIFVLFLGVFWPMLMNVINRVGEMDKRIIDCARALNVSTPTMLFKIILPYCVPGILGGFSVSISISFMILTMAEMIGVDSGIGYFVSRSAENSQYAKVIAGIILIGFMVTCLNGLVNMAKKRFLRWI